MNYQEEVEASASLNREEAAGWNRDVEAQEPLVASVLSKDGEKYNHNPLAPHLVRVVSWAKQQGIGVEEVQEDSYSSDIEYFLKYKEQIREALSKALVEENVKANLAGKGNTKLTEVLASDEIVLPSNMEFTEALEVLDNQAVHEGSFGYLNEPLPPAKGFVPTKSKKSK